MRRVVRKLTEQHAWFRGALGARFPTGSSPGRCFAVRSACSAPTRAVERASNGRQVRPRRGSNCQPCWRPHERNVRTCQPQVCARVTCYTAHSSILPASAQEGPAIPVRRREGRPYGGRQSGTAHWSTRFRLAARRRVAEGSTQSK